jgi:hypothetical protein
MMKFAAIAPVLEKGVNSDTGHCADLLVSQIEDEYNPGRELLQSGKLIIKKCTTCCCSA